MINLFENYGEKEVDLEYSLKSSGQANLTIVLNEDGFLPPHVVSPIGFFTKMDMYKKTSRNKAKFFNALNLPPYWEVRSTGQQAEIYEGYKKKGHIHYSQRPGDYRIIQSVDWLNEEGRVRSIDLYNQNGQIFSKKTYSDGTHAMTTYFDLVGRETVIVNHILQTFQVYYNQKRYIFSDYTSFILFYLEAAQLPVEKILYNSLGHPYFVVEALKKRYSEKQFDHTLFWQEISQVMPGNMRGILAQSSPGTTKIVVQDQGEFDRLKLQAPKNEKVQVSYLGYLYPFKEEGSLHSEILIHTNSDQLEAIQELIDTLPDFHFHISARTEMSQKLMHLEHLSQVSLYPNITSLELEGLLSKSSFYLDINQGAEVDHVLRRAFEHNLLIFSFKETQHSARLINPDFVYNKNDYMSLVHTMIGCVSSPEVYFEAIQRQQRSAGQSSVEEYKEMMR